jgi:hypothetical protein
MTTQPHAPHLATILGALAVAVLAGAPAPATAGAATRPAVPPVLPRPPAPAKTRPVALAPRTLRLRADRQESGVTLRLL